MSLTERYRSNTEAFIQSFSHCSDEVFNKRPSSGGWSIGEVVEHIYRAEFGTTRLFSGETTLEEERDSEAKISYMYNRFLISDESLNAFGTVLPTDGEKNKEELIEKIQNNREAVIQLMDMHNLDELCLKFAHPLFGHLTKREWIEFNMIHVLRHMRQIERVLSEI